MLRGLALLGLLAAASSKSAKERFLGAKAAVHPTQLHKAHHAPLKVASSMRFVSTDAKLQKAAGAPASKDSFGYDKFRFARMKAMAKAETKAKVQAKAKAGFSAPPNGVVPSSPYEYMSPSGRGFQDVNTPFYGHYAGVYGPMGGPPSVSRGYGSFPNTIDPRGFGAHSSFPHPWSMNYSTPWSSYLHGIWPTPPKGFATWMGSGAEGFKYQVPWAQFAPSAPFSGNPFQQTSPLGPYKQTLFGLKTDQQSAMLNYTQFGPSPFGPYGVNNRYSRQWGSIPMGVVPGAMGAPLGAFGGMGPMPFHHSGFIPASFPGGMGHAGGMGHHVGMGAGGAPHVGMVGFGGFGWAGLPRGASYPGFPGSMVGGISGSRGLLNGISNGGPFGPFPFGPLGPAASPGNMYQGAMPIGNNAFAGALPGIPSKYSPNLAAHHATVLPGNRGQFREPGYLHNFGEGYPTPDFDRYSSVSQAIPSPAGAEAAK